MQQLIKKENRGNDSQILTGSFFNANTRNAIKNFDMAGVVMMRAVPEEHIINFWPYDCIIN